MIKMFYQGDLQSGISKAVQEAKLVACFVAGKYPSYITAPGWCTDMCLQMMAGRVSCGKMIFSKKKL